MSLADWVGHLNRGRPFFYLADLMKLGGQSRQTARKTAQRLRKQGLLMRVGPELYANGLRPPSIEAAACVLRPAYISFEHALFLHGLLSQATTLVTCATLGRPGRVTTDLGEIEYRHIKDALYHGFEPTPDGLLATPEKALLDLLYLRLRQGEKPRLDELDPTLLDQTTLTLLARFYPRSVRSLTEWGSGSVQ